MKSRPLATAIAWSIGLGLLVALPLGAQRRISIEIWFIGFTVWFLVNLAIGLMRAAPPTSTSNIDLRGWLPERWRRRKTNDLSQLRDQRAIEGLLIRARDNERSHDKQLRPRLQDLADHFLGIDHRGDKPPDPAVADKALGEVAWLIDPAVTGRSPTLAEIDLFLDRVDGSGAESVQAESAPGN